MTATPRDPLATQHDSIPDPDNEAPADTQTLRLREENRALRELLAAQVQAALPQQQPGLLRRLCWGLISAPGAALVEWRSLIGRDDASTPITRRRVGYATLTVLYTLAIYGALVLLVVSWSSPNITVSGATAAGPVRVPLVPAPPLPPGADPVLEQITAPGKQPAPPPAEPGPSPAMQQPAQPAAQPAAAAASPPTAPRAPAAAATASPAESHAKSTAPHSTLRITEIAAPDPLVWMGTLKEELARCAELGFFERPECAWAARKQYCEPNHGWGKVKECPAQP